MFTQKQLSFATLMFLLQSLLDGNFHLVVGDFSPDNSYTVA